jgi:hypothetical protein
MDAAQEPRIVGRYELYGELAAGGMATVHLGRSIGAAGFAKSVAIKRLHENFARDPEFVALLLEEARLSERIRHPNVVATLDVVAAEHELLLVMEYVHGETLARLLRACAEHGKLCPPEIAASIAHAVLLGLHAAHGATETTGAPLCIVHRDVSPQNIIVGADGVARLLDFGIAKAAGAASHTREGEVKGKVPYMAPEILKLEPASPQSDLYAVAVTLWESLCARRLFRGDSQVSVWAAVLEGEVTPPSLIAGPLGALDDVVMRGLARSKSARYPTAMAMAQALESAIRLAPSSEVASWVAERAAVALAERSSRVREIECTPPRACDAPPAPSSARAPARAPGPVPRRRGTWVLVALVAFAVLGLAGVRLSGPRRARAIPPPPLVSTAQPELASAPSAAPPLATAATDSALPAVEARHSGTSSPRPRRPATPPKGEGAASARPAPAQDPCDPPFTIDEAGRKHFKLNCVN